MRTHFFTTAIDKKNLHMKKIFVLLFAVILSAISCEESEKGFYAIGNGYKLKVLMGRKAIVNESAGDTLRYEYAMQTQNCL